jgi:WD40 repeat protein
MYGNNFSALSPDRTQIVALRNLSSEINLFDAVIERMIRTFAGRQSEVNSVTFNPNGKYLVSASGGSYLRKKDYTVSFWSVESGREIRVFFGHTEL